MAGIECPAPDAINGRRDLSWQTGVMFAVLANLIVVIGVLRFAVSADARILDLVVISAQVL